MTKDRRTKIADLVFLSRAGVRDQYVCSQPADVAAGQLINPSQLLERKTSYPRQTDPPVCIYGDQFHRKISSSPLLEVRKINSGRGAACKSQSRRCNIQTHKQGDAIFKHTNTNKDVQYFSLNIANMQYLNSNNAMQY